MLHKLHATALSTSHNIVGSVCWCTEHVSVKLMELLLLTEEKYSSISDCVFRFILDIVGKPQ